MSHNPNERIAKLLRQLRAEFPDASIRYCGRFRQWRSSVQTPMYMTGDMDAYVWVRIEELTDYHDSGPTCVGDNQEGLLRRFLKKARRFKALTEATL